MKENKRKKEWKCVDLPSCSSLLRLKPLVWASVGVSGLLSDSTHTVSCDTNSPHPSPTPENSVKRDGQRKEREREKESRRPICLTKHTRTKLRGWLAVYPSPVLNWEKTEQAQSLDCPAPMIYELWITFYLLFFQLEEFARSLFREKLKQTSGWTEKWMLCCIINYYKFWLLRHPDLRPQYTSN